MAKTELFSIVNKDHITLQSKELIASLLVYWSNLHYELTVKARTNSYHNSPLKDYLFWGKIFINSTILSNHQFEKIKYYKNFIISYNHVKLHMILTRPKKTIHAGNIIEEGRGLLFPLHSKSEFSLQILEKFHELYCGSDISYPIRKI